MLIVSSSNAERNDKMKHDKLLHRTLSAAVALSLAALSGSATLHDIPEIQAEDKGTESHAEFINNSEPAKNSTLNGSRQETEPAFGEGAHADEAKAPLDIENDPAEISKSVISYGIVSASDEDCGVSELSQGEEKPEMQQESSSAFSDSSDIFPGDDALFQSYIDHLTYLHNPEAAKQEGKLPQISGRAEYDEVTEALIAVIKEKVALIADGQTDSNVVNIRKAEITERLSDASLLDSYDLKTHRTNIHRTLLNECPYELYWYDKSKGVSFSQWPSGAEYLYTLVFNVSSDYYTAPPANPDESSETTLDPEKVRAAKEAAANISYVYAGLNDKWEYANEEQNWTDYSILFYFARWIMEFNEYNTETSGRDYGDPWQLIYVFDDNDETNVVCEGYSKAFKYLCDNYKGFNSKIECRIVSGYMTGATGAGNHMWNVVEFGGRNYLVDVTNCDTGYDLFMAGSTDRQYQNNKLKSIVVDGVTFAYNMDSMYSCYKESELLIAEEECPTYTVTWLNSNGGLLEKDIFVGMGENPVYHGSTPTYKQGYQFSGWNADLSPVLGDVTYTAQYTYNGTGNEQITYSKSDDSAVYDGNVKYPNGVTVSDPINAVIKYGTSQDDCDLDSVPGWINAGTHTVYFKITAENHADVSDSYTFTITAAENSWVTEPSISGWKYGDAASDPSGDAKFGEVVFEYSDSPSGTFSAEKPSNAGEYYMKASVPQDSNVSNTLSEIVPFTISRADISCTVNNKAVAYSGSEQSPESVTVTSPAGAEVLYGSLSNECTLTQPPKYTNVGIYNVYYTVSAGKNYNNASGSYLLTVEKTNNEWKTQPSISGWTYGNSASVPSASAYFGTPSFTYSDSENGTYSSNVPSKSGSYFMKATVAGTSNYNELSAVVPFEISAANLQVDVPSALSVTYDGKPHSAPAVSCSNAAASVAYGTQDGSYTLSSPPQFTNAGSYTVYFRASAENYNTKTGSYSVNITRAENQWINEPSISGWTEGEKQSVPSASAKFGTPVFMYSNSENGTYYSDMPSAAGDYWMKAAVISTKNYGALEKTVKFTIGEKPLPASDSDKAKTSDTDFNTDTPSKPDVSTDASTDTIKPEITSDSENKNDSNAGNDSDGDKDKAESSDTDTGSEQSSDIPKDSDSAPDSGKNGTDSDQSIESDDQPKADSDSDPDKSSDTVRTNDTPSADSSDIDTDTQDSSGSGKDTDTASGNDSDDLQSDSDKKASDTDTVPSDSDTRTSDTDDKKPDDKPQKPTRKPGDVSNDNCTDSFDALIILRFTIQLQDDLSEEDLMYADVDGDGFVTSADALLILRYSLGLEPIENLKLPALSSGNHAAADTYTRKD